MFYGSLALGVESRAESERLEPVQQTSILGNFDVKSKRGRTVSCHRKMGAFAESMGCVLAILLDRGQCR